MYLRAMPIIAPSILSADFGNLQRDIEMLNQSEAEWIHVDIMDGNFVPNISFGTPVLKTVSQHSKKIIDVHVMMEKPDRYIETFIQAGAQQLCLHIEALTHADSALRLIGAGGAKAGLAINPHTPIENVYTLLPLCSHICVMSVNPGFGGQKFIPYVLEKIKKLKAYIQENKLTTLIQVDGGVDTTNAQEIVKAGADVLVAGNAVFSSDNPTSIIHKLKHIV